VERGWGRGVPAGVERLNCVGAVLVVGALCWDVRYVLLEFPPVTDPLLSLTLHPWVLHPYHHHHHHHHHTAGGLPGSHG
jgi:hypothetical protein